MIEYDEENEREFSRLWKEYQEAVKNGTAPDLRGRRDRHKPDVCPECGSATVADIIYGFVDVSRPDLRKQLDEAKVVLGGCCDAVDGPDWHCTSCGLDIHGPRFPFLLDDEE